MSKVQVGEIVRVRCRQYLVEAIIPGSPELRNTVVCLSCLEDDALGNKLQVFWEREGDARIIGKPAWDRIVTKGFDEPQLFSAYLHAWRWNCVTSTNAELFQAPYRAGIEVKAYQLEPLRKALLMPRVNLFIADDVGLGKTIEAGLILREMLIRQKVKRVVISCPASVVRQWQEEMETRFGLSFAIFDREFVAQCRRERGYGINPWVTNNQFIISHALLRDETYAAPLRDWLGNFSGASLLILDEAHNAAPASGAKYAVDSQLTRLMRDLAPRFEHKLFLSATPHNGHSNSFAALLEILDPQRFCRGVPVRNTQLLDAVMVRRLKQDLRAIGEEFPQRLVIPIVIDNLPIDAPELKLSKLLQEYRGLREERLKDATKSTQNAAMLVITCLQKRLLSSIEAFARTLKVHCAALEKPSKPINQSGQKFTLLVESPGADDERAQLTEAEVETEEDIQLTTVSQQIVGGGLSNREWAVLREMTDIANQARYAVDSRLQRLIDWIKEHLCPDLGKPGANWLDKRVIIFTEYTDTKTYLVRQLRAAIAHSDGAQERIGVFHGGMGKQQAEDVKKAFNAEPCHHPLRILIATDAAREGVNLQNHCADLFHFDIPWNPSRMEQRNGRIDRKLQRAPVVNCYYFILAQRAEDKVLDVLVRKTETIQRELGTLSPVVQENLSRYIEGGIRHDDVNSISSAIEQSKFAAHGVMAAEMPRVSGKGAISYESAGAALGAQLGELQQMLQSSQDWLQFSDEHFRSAISAALGILGAEGLKPVDTQRAYEDVASAAWRFPPLDKEVDTSWVKTLDSLRVPRQREQKLWEWRKEAPIRPIIFRDAGSLDEDVVHLHLEHKVVQRLLGIFLSQGFTHNELSRACVCLTDKPIPYVVVFGRVSLYGQGASRLHDEIIAVAAQWAAPEVRGGGKLQALDMTTTENIIQLVEMALVTPRLHNVPQGAKEKLQMAAPLDITDLIPDLESLSERLIHNAKQKLTERGKKEGVAMKKILQEQQNRINQRIQEIETNQKESEDCLQLSLSIPYLDNPEEKRQLEADKRHWQQRLTTLKEEIETEPRRIKAAYEVKNQRLQPVGIVYLWPISG